MWRIHLPASSGRSKMALVHSVIALLCITNFVAVVVGEKEPVYVELNASSHAGREVSRRMEPFGSMDRFSSWIQTSTGFVHAFAASLSVIIVSELGDKTFFIAAIMAMRHSRLTVFVGAMSALALMTVLSALFGWATTVIPRAYTYYISTFLFAIFGLKMLKEGYYMAHNEGQEEFEEVQTDLRRREDEFEKEVVQPLTQDVETGVISGGRRRQKMLVFMSRILFQSFTLTFLAEWGDRSQLATIILAAREDITGVTVGGILGHALCTGLAVLGGRYIAQKISVRTVTMIGGVVFLLFAVSALFFDPNQG